MNEKKNGEAKEKMPEGLAASPKITAPVKKFGIRNRSNQLLPITYGDRKNRKRLILRSRQIIPGDQLDQAIFETPEFQRLERDGQVRKVQ